MLRDAGCQPGEDGARGFQVVAGFAQEGDDLERGLPLHVGLRRPLPVGPLPPRPLPGLDTTHPHLGHPHRRHDDHPRPDADRHALASRATRLLRLRRAAGDRRIAPVQVRVEKVYERVESGVLLLST